MTKLIHNLTNSPNLVERIRGIDRDIDTLNAKVGSIPEGMDVGQSIIDLQDNKQDKLTAGEGISIENNVISNTQRPAEWGNITGDITDQVDLQNELSSISDSIPTKTSDLTNDSGFITNSVNDLVNYYLKSETYTQEEVNNLIGSIQSFHYEIYPTIGSITTPLSNVLYLIGPSGTGSDRYEEYVYSNNNFVKIGETSIDLSGYVTIDNLNNALSNYTTTANLTTLLAQKQDVLTAGAGISIINNVISNTIPGATISNTAPSNPTQGMLRYDTVNDALKSYDGSNWNEVGNESSDINTKAFYLSGTSDLTNAQAAYDWFSAGKNPIVMYNNRAYLLYAKNATQLIFQDIENSAHDQDSYTEYVGQKVIFTLSGNDVTAINYNNTSGWSGPILRTDVDYPTPYTPAYAGSPTTKQYVDNNDTYIGASAPTGNVVEGRLWYDTANDVLKVYDGTNWNEVGGDTYTAGTGINIDSNNEISVDTSVVATQTDLNSKQDTLTTGNGINIDSNNEISADTSVLATQTDLQNGLNEKQDKLTAGDNIQISNTNIISATDTTYNAGENITIEDICTTESDMKGPCPSGFHIPTSGELGSIINIWTALGGGSTDVANFCATLKMPLAGKIYSSGLYYRNVTCSYRTSNFSFGSSYDYANVLQIDSQYSGRINMSRECTYVASSIRPFKNNSIVPDSTWTMLYGISIAAGGIFWNSTDGLISLSSDGQSWITMTDKNLGATTVWNNGDVLNDGNCGSYFQRGNNYGFPSSGYQKDTQTIDTTGYGPGNYYTDNIFHDDYTGRFTPVNANLRGGETQGTFQDCIHNVISAEDTTYTAGNGINIDANNEISNTLPGPIVSSVAPTTPSEGDLWYDTTNDVLNTYNGTQWIHTGKKIVAGEGITLGQSGPFGEGYHVPSNTEWNNVADILKTTFGLAAEADTTRDYLKMPTPGAIYCTTGNYVHDSGNGWYWTSSSSDARLADTLYSSASFINTTQSFCADGCSLRLFKDLPVVPDNTWTTLYDGSSVATGAGVFHNTTDGLISISGDGITWYTIKDKNEGATTVYNNGDAFSEANCGKWYQWGNCYGFPYALGQTISTTKVDTTGYGPGNYYSSSTFIKTGLTDGQWSTVVNTSLWNVDQSQDVVINSGVLSVNGQTGNVTVTDTTYTAGTGLTLNGTTFNVDTTTIATKADIANLGTFVVVASLPSVGTANTKTIYLLGPIGTGADKYEEWIVTEDSQQQKQWTKIGETSMDLSGYATTSDLNSGLATKQDTLTAGNGININANNEISNTLPGPTIAATAPSNPIEGQLWYDTTNDVLKTYDGTNWSEAGTKMVVLEYGVSTWQNFLDAYNKNALVYCKVSSGSSGYRMAFMAYTAGQGTPTEVEFQYYRSRSSHSQDSTQLDEVYVYKLTDAGVWSTTTRDTGARITNGTGISISSVTSSGITTRTISADTTVLATQTDLNNKQDTLVSGTNIKTVNNESLLGTGNITISAPTYTAGDNITIDQNNEISAVDTTYDAGSGIAIGAAHSDMQGPAPDGFHVPSRNEWIALFETLITTFSMARDATTIGTYLKMPLAGDRISSSSNVGGQGTIGRYRSSTPYSTNKAYFVEAYSSTIQRQSMAARTFGLSVRCFKDTPVVPDNSWTTLYDGSSIATGAGVYYNSTLGLISVSGDGQNWLTIADKNLGATTVYNNGDTLSEANCGYYYQWGNNYGFSWEGIVTNSPTQVDASAYGPGNYYNSSTFITTNDWSSVQNDNLWGGVSQGIWVGGDGNIIANTGVLSVNGQTGNVTINTSEASSITTTQPGNPVEGDVYYDTSDDVIKVYDGTNWNTTKEEYTAGEGIEIGTTQDYSAMRGPCPEGFHVPLITEWQGLETIMRGLSLTTGDGWRINLHIPFAGERSNSSSSVSQQGDGAFYWSSSPYGSEYPYNAWYIYLNSGNVLSDNFYYRSYGSSIRGFKDIYVTPDNTWTVIQGTLGSAGIFWNQSEGLISITNGTTGYTIMDKNLGATTVYNDGDTLTQANMGNMYQWGNNYGFPSTGTISNTSSTQVDASAYGPGNYYNSDTFITRSTPQFDWSSVTNNNLWGGETGIVTTNNIITNTGVLSVNGQTGNVTVSNTEYTAGEGIEIKNLYDYSAMQGPAPTGYHVPLSTEREAVYNIWTALGGGTSAGVAFGTALKMPRAGLRYNSSSSEGLQGTYGNYWSSTAYSADSAYCLLFTSSGIRSQIPYKYAYGFPIRCFKDSPVIPDTSWTMLYGTSIDAGGIFWNSTDGLISMSSDGTTWITIQDKNLGATQVRNSGDTLSAANCGGYFQWGNNYMFPFAGSVTTSSTQVDASSYGPGNYYSNSTFIIGNNNWSSVQNDNLRGGVTGVVTINNAITNTGVLSVNGQTGDVIIENGSNVRVFTVNPFIINGDTVSQSQQDFNTLMEMGRWIAEGFSYPNNETNRVAILRGSSGHGLTGMEFVSIVNVKTTPHYVNDNHWDCSDLSITYSGNRGGDTSYAVDFGINSSSTSIFFNSTSYGYFTPGIGTTGQVLTKTSSGYNWQDASGGFKLAPNSPLTPKYRRYGTQAQYDALTQYYTDEEGDTVYFTI